MTATNYALHEDDGLLSVEEEALLASQEEVCEPDFSLPHPYLSAAENEKIAQNKREFLEMRQASEFYIGERHCQIVTVFDADARHLFPQMAHRQGNRPGWCLWHDYRFDADCLGLPTPELPITAPPEVAEDRFFARLLAEIRGEVMD